MVGMRCLTLCAALSLLSGMTAHADDIVPMDLLEAMSQAGQTVNYRGSFTYEHSNFMESFRVLHWVEGDRSHDRLEALSGPETSVQRLWPVAGCHPVGYRLLQAGVTQDSAEVDVASLDEYYQLTLRGQDRIAGRPTYTLEVRPHDRLRYGYILNLDQETGLLLRSLLIDENQGVLERFQFVELELESDPETLRTEAEALFDSDAPAVNCDTQNSDSPSRWVLTWTPPGFTYSGERQLADNMDMLMYTDGLASFSVFLEPVSGQISIEGRAKSGATSAYMGRVAAGSEDYRVTVVGEIPVHVAEQLARGISPLYSPAVEE